MKKRGLESVKISHNWTVCRVFGFVLILMKFSLNCLWQGVHVVFQWISTIRYRYGFWANLCSKTGTRRINYIMCILLPTPPLKKNCIKIWLKIKLFKFCIYGSRSFKQISNGSLIASSSGINKKHGKPRYGSQKTAMSLKHANEVKIKSRNHLREIDAQYYNFVQNPPVISKCLTHWLFNTII
jgi:hypothetical protein